MDLSLVIPVYNEVESLSPLKDALDAVATGLGGEVEYVFVDDGSTDGSFEALQRMQEADPARVKLLAFRRNQGKSAALAAAFEVVQGTYVVTRHARETAGGIRSGLRLETQTQRSHLQDLAFTPVQSCDLQGVGCVPA